jgi:hypothetical protein
MPEGGLLEQLAHTRAERVTCGKTTVVMHCGQHVPGVGNTVDTSGAGWETCTASYRCAAASAMNSSDSSSSSASCRNAENLSATCSTSPRDSRYSERKKVSV